MISYLTSMGEPCSIVSSHKGVTSSVQSPLVKVIEEGSVIRIELIMSATSQVMVTSFHFDCGVCIPPTSLCYNLFYFICSTLGSVARRLGMHRRAAKNGGAEERCFNMILAILIRQCTNSTPLLLWKVDDSRFLKCWSLYHCWKPLFFQRGSGL